MKGIKSYKTIRKSIVIILILSMMVPILTAFTGMYALAVSSVSLSNFVGYSGNADIEEETNTEKLADGTYTNPVSDLAPQITFLIPGLGGNASHWSNNYQIGITEQGGQVLAYNI